MMLVPKPVIYSWRLQNLYINDKQFKIFLDIFKGGDTIIIENNLLEYLNHMRLKEFLKLEIQIPSKDYIVTFRSYINEL